MSLTIYSVTPWYIKQTVSAVVFDDYKVFFLDVLVIEKIRQKILKKNFRLIFLLVLAQCDDDELDKNVEVLTQYFI